MLAEQDFHTEEVEFSTIPPHRIPLLKQPKIHPTLIGKVPNWLNLASWPVRTLYFNYQPFGSSVFKVDQNLPRDLQNYYYPSAEYVAYSEKVLLETSKGRQPIVVSPGVYINATTDQYFIRKYDAKVIGVDPTPIVPKYIDYCYKIGYFKKDQYILEPSALSSKVGTAEFSFGEEVMGRIGEDQGKTTKVKTVDLNYIIDKYKLPAIDLLQIDIEGGEFDVIDHFEEIKLPIPQICIEIHNLNNLSFSFNRQKQMKDALQKLRNLGYKVVDSYEPWYQSDPIFQALLIHQDYLK